MTSETANEGTAAAGEDKPPRRLADVLSDVRSANGEGNRPNRFTDYVMFVRRNADTATAQPVVVAAATRCEAIGIDVRGRFQGNPLMLDCAHFGLTKADGLDAVIFALVLRDQAKAHVQENGLPDVSVTLTDAAGEIIPDQINEQIAPLAAFNQPVDIRRKLEALGLVPKAIPWGQLGGGAEAFGGF